MKRWMKLLTIPIILVLIIVIGIGWRISQNDEEHDHVKTYGITTGLNLDAARIYYRPSTLRKYIDTVSANHGNYVMLHLTDNENFGVENQFLGQTVKDAKVLNGVYINRKTNKPFLSKAQLKSLIEYGKKRHVMVFPEIEFPGHSQSTIKLLKLKNYPHLKSMMAFKDEFNFDDSETTLYKKIISEYMPLLPKNSFFGTGGDEISLDGSDDEEGIREFDNNINRYLRSHGLRMMVWNDSIVKSQLKNYDKTIVVNYWSQTSAVSDSANKRHLLSQNATLPEINRAGLKTINNNQNMTYIVVEKNSLNQSNYDSFKQNINSFNPGLWDDLDDAQQAPNSNNLGSGISIWSDPKANYTSTQIETKTKPWLTSYFKRVNEFN